MDENWYDTAQICLNGHIITQYLTFHPEQNQRFCVNCGSQTLNKCEQCNASIRGFYHLAGQTYSSELKLPSFCHNCGKPYPWTEAKLKAAKELSDVIEELTVEEREILKNSLDDIVQDTPRTPVAATRFKKIMTKAGKVAYDGMKFIIFDIASEAAKKMIWPS